MPMPPNSFENRGFVLLQGVIAVEDWLETSLRVPLFGTKNLIHSLVQILRSAVWKAQGKLRMT
jgi:hypothetical protein